VEGTSKAAAFTSWARCDEIANYETEEGGAGPVRDIDIAMRLGECLGAGA